MTSPQDDAGNSFFICLGALSREAAAIQGETLRHDVISPLPLGEIDD